MTRRDKEEQAYFPEIIPRIASLDTQVPIEHELGRRIGRMFIRNLRAWKEDKIDSTEPEAQFLKSYSVLTTDRSFFIM